MAKMGAAFLKERAPQLAIVYLTRRDDVLVTPNPSPAGPALLASLLQDGQDVGRHLGVEAHGAISERGLKRSGDAIEFGAVSLDATAPRETPYPVCLFFFTMNDDQGYWKWVWEPITDGARAGGLSFNQDTELIKLTNQELGSIWKRVEEWYQRREQLVAA